MTSTTELTLAELARQGDVTPRTVRYYIAQGLLPGPDGQSGAARYGVGHLDRIRLIKRLQLNHLPLADIRARLSALGDEEVAGLIAEPEELAPAPAQGERALNYIRDLLGKSTSQVRETSPRYAAARMAPALPASASWQATAPLPSAAAAAPAPSPSKPSAPERSTWERIALSPDIELHVRRPLDRQSNKDLDQLLALARELFNRP